MLTSFFKPLFILLLVFNFLFTGCSKKDDNSNQNGQIQAQIENYVQTGNWGVTKFIESGNDETANFNGYTFTFGSDGTLNATNGSNTYQGSWSISDSNSDDDSQDDLHFNINFNLTNNFENLNEDWNFITQAETKIELIHVSGGNGGTDYLTFEKN